MHCQGSGKILSGNRQSDSIYLSKRSWKLLRGFPPNLLTPLLPYPWKPTKSFLHAPTEGVEKYLPTFAITSLKRIGVQSVFWIKTVKNRHHAYIPRAAGTVPRPLKFSSYLALIFSHLTTWHTGHGYALAGRPQNVQRLTHTAEIVSYQLVLGTNKWFLGCVKIWLPHGTTWMRLIWKSNFFHSQNHCDVDSITDAFSLFSLAMPLSTHRGMAGGVF